MRANIRCPSGQMDGFAAWGVSVPPPLRGGFGGRGGPVAALRLPPANIRCPFGTKGKLHFALTKQLRGCATTWECLRVSARIVARSQRLTAIKAPHPGRCPGLSCCGLSGRVFALSFGNRNLRACGPGVTRTRRSLARLTGLETCATLVCHGFSGFTLLVRIPVGPGGGG